MTESAAVMERTPDLVIDSVTGVDVALSVAGPGARSFAFVVDWHIRTILCIAWYVVAALVYNGHWSLAPPLSPDAAWFVFVITPPAATYFLYHPVLEIAMHGRTPGKRMAGLHIVTRDGGVPTVGALLTRNVFRLIDSFPLLYGVGLIATMLTRNHVRVGDLAAGTLLAYNRADTSLLDHVTEGPLGGKLDATSAEVVNELLRRWSTLDGKARRRLARSVLSRYDAAPVKATPSETVPSGAIEKRTSGTDDDASLRAQLEQLARGGTL